MRFDSYFDLNNKYHDIYEEMSFKKVYENIEDMPTNNRPLNTM